MPRGSFPSLHPVSLVPQQLRQRRLTPFYSFILHPCKAREATKRAEQVARDARQDTEALTAAAAAAQAEAVARVEAQLAEQKAAAADASARAAQLESSLIDAQRASPESSSRDAAEEARLTGKLQSLEEMCQSRAEQMEELRASLAASTQRFTTLASQNQSLQQELLALRAAKEEGQDEQGNLERATSEMRLQLERKDVRITTLETELAAMQSTVDDATYAKQEAEVGCAPGEGRVGVLGSAWGGDECQGARGRFCFSFLFNSAARLTRPLNACLRARWSESRRASPAQLRKARRSRPPLPPSLSR